MFIIRPVLRPFYRNVRSHFLDTLKYLEIDERFVSRDKFDLRTTRNLRKVPQYQQRIGGNASFVEWGHTIGIFQTIINLYAPATDAPQILDVGCGNGLLGIACEPLLQNGGHYTGIDVSTESIAFCRHHYSEDYYSFLHLDVQNRHYAPKQGTALKSWDIADESQDLVTAKSVWTHFNEAHARFYFREVERVLKPGGRAIITFFLLDDHYELEKMQSKQVSQYHSTAPQKWIFDQASSESGNWQHPEWATTPEAAIAVTPAGLQSMLEETSLSHIETHTGNWKEYPGLYFQDILIFEK